MAALASAIGFAADYLSNTLRQEADRYSASYTGQGACQEFWMYDGQSRVQNTYGLEFTRYVPGDTDPAFACLFVILPSKDNTAFAIEPAVIRVNKCKAKVLSYEVKDWYTTLWTWMLKTGTAVDVAIRIEIDVTWTDSEMQTHTATACDFTLPVGAIDLANPQDKTDFTAPAAWLAGIPTSAPRGDQAGGTGTFSLRVTVHERDPSNAQNILEKAADRLQTYTAKYSSSSVSPKDVPRKQAPSNPLGL
jgi:hypothetical protein